MSKTVLFIGLGGVGGPALIMLARNPGIDKIVATGRDKALCEFKVNAAATNATYFGYDTNVEFTQHDVSDVEATARLLSDVRPDIIFLSVSTNPPGAFGNVCMAPETREKLRNVGFGVQLPWHLKLAAKFTEALGKTGIECPVVNASLPDITGPAIWKHFGYGPTVGLGNCDVVANRISRHLAQAEGVPLDDITLYLVCSHALSSSGSQLGMPFFLKILIRGNDVTDNYNVKELTQRPPDDPDLKGRRSETLRYYNTTIAASAVKNIIALLSDATTFAHAPAPNGLIGGYPVNLGKGRVEVVLPPEITLKQAIKINEESEKFDGIETIKNDGTVVFTEQNYRTMKELGYDCKELAFDDLEVRGRELERLLERLSVNE